VDVSRRFSWRKALLVVGGLAATAAVGFGGWYILVREGILRYNKYDRRVRGTLKPGDVAPDLALAAYGGETVRLSDLWKDKPVVLVFGSCT
jgi:hypothetical protein